MYSKEFGINLFGSESNKKRKLNKIEILRKNINNFAKGLANTYKNLNFDELSLGSKLTGAINNQVNSIADEIQAGTIVGKSSLNVLNELNNLSNKQIRDFSFNPQLQLDFVNNLAEQQKNKIFDLSFNAIPESTIFENQVNNLQNTSIDSFIGSTNLDFTFGNDKIVNETTISKSLMFFKGWDFDLILKCVIIFFFI